MATPSTQTDKAALLSMVVVESLHYMVLQIWDGRFAAFYKSGFDTEHCTAVAQHGVVSENGKNSTLRRATAFT